MFPLNFYVFFQEPKSLSLDKTNKKEIIQLAGPLSCFAISITFNDNFLCKKITCIVWSLRTDNILIPGRYLIASFRYSNAIIILLQKSTILSMLTCKHFFTLSLPSSFFYCDYIFQDKMLPIANAICIWMCVHVWHNL